MAKKKATVERSNGEPVVVNQITIAQLTRGNQDIQKWFSAVKSAENALVPRKRELLTTYTDICIDLHLDMLMDKRARAITTSPFEWQGLENDVYLQNLTAPWFGDLLRAIMDRVFWGTTVVEFVFAESLIQRLENIPRHHLRPHLGVISLDGTSETGISYKEGVFQNFVLQIGSDRELGKLAKVAPYVLMKRLNLADFSRYNEMFGMPLRVYEYDANMPGARAEIEKQAKDYGSAAYIVIPKDMGRVTFQDSVKQSTAFAYDKLHDILNNELTIGILGQSLTTVGQEGGSRALGSVHKSVEQAVNLEDRLYAEYVLNFPFKNNILIPNGYPLQGITGAFKAVDELPKELKANMWVMLSNNGLPIAEEDFYTEFGVPMPGGRPVIVNSSPSLAQPGGAGAKKS